MYHGMAVSGNLGNLLFKKSIAASPYLPFQYNYNDALPTNRYYAFSVAAGCPATGDVFACLVSKDTDTLQAANFAVTNTATYGYWGFWPVTDNVYITKTASEQLTQKKVNGQKLLVGYNANEGPLFTPPVITTESDLVGWLQQQFPNLNPSQINSILAVNPNDALTDRENGLRYETPGTGTGNSTAVHVSGNANGQQQRGDNIYAEATFACPAYWLADAYSQPGKAAYTYQYSVPVAVHGADLAAYFGPPGLSLSADFVRAFQQVWGNFVKTGNPSISNEVANGASSPNPAAPNPASAWPAWNPTSPQLMNLNSTGGVPYEVEMQWGTNVTQLMGPGQVNAISVGDAVAWEGGRKARCDFYKSIASSIPA